MTDDNIGLCFRCEHRAKFMESGRGPRSECKDSDSCVSGCYMYRPVVPVVTAPNKGDNRNPYWPSLIAGRSRAVRVAKDEIVAYVREVDGGTVVLYGLKRDVDDIFRIRWYQVPCFVFERLRGRLRALYWRVAYSMGRLFCREEDYY